jgi:orotidine-5'-phosphate decarboxylase
MTSISQYLDSLLDDKEKAFLCVGLDLVPQRIPPRLSYGDYMRQLIEQLDAASALKFNFAFMERFFSHDGGLAAMLRSTKINRPVTIADAKRCDVGHSAEHYAARIFDELQFDAVTVSPYMGCDSLEPFLARKGKLTFALALTSNPGADDFQFHPYSSLDAALKACREPGCDEPLFVRVVKKLYAHAQTLPGEIGFVAGATRPEAVGLIRSLAPEAYLLIPGVGTQGGNVEDVIRQAQRRILINVSRDVIYAYENDENIARHNPEWNRDEGEWEAAAAAHKARQYVQTMRSLISDT